MSPTEVVSYRRLLYMGSNGGKSTKPLYTGNDMMIYYLPADIAGGLKKMF
jgi:hypothetical protein